MNNEISRFIKAQDRDYEQALYEITLGRKSSCWMWYIFPQFIGLGHSETSKFYAIKSLNEAKEYLDHPILGSRLKEITNVLLKLDSASANQIFGSPDDLKLKSCMTLFSFIYEGDDNIFKKVIDKYFDNHLDERTLKLINKSKTMWENRITPKWIDKLYEKEVFVFGSNFAGQHLGGAAKLATKWGAVWGQGVGLHGQTYAIPTMQGGVDTIKPYVDDFLLFAKSNPNLKFLVTEIGCGIAGFTVRQIAPLFKQAINDNIENVCLPYTFYEELAITE